MNFDKAFSELMKHEGGYSNHPSDPGGETNWGVTKRVAQAHGYQGSMKLLPKDIAKDIAKKEYWDKVNAELLPAAVRYAVFDTAYHSGNRQALVLLQRTLGVTEDGVFGMDTLIAVKACNPDVLTRKYLGARLNFLTDLKNWKDFSRGWSKRIASLLSMEAAYE